MNEGESRNKEDREKEMGPRQAILAMKNWDKHSEEKKERRATLKNIISSYP